MSATSRTQSTGVNLAMTSHFRSIGRTGTGAAETIPHGLGYTPVFVLAQARTNTNSVAFAATPWDATNIYVTVANGAVYDLLTFNSGE